jgi:hypothetical protein
MDKNAEQQKATSTPLMFGFSSLHPRRLTVPHVSTSGLKYRLRGAHFRLLMDGHGQRPQWAWKGSFVLAE